MLSLQWVFLEDWNWAADGLLTLDWESGLAAQGDQEVLVIPSGPADKRETATLMFTHAINSAQKRIWRYSGGFMHQKVMLIDDEVACVGTANFDNRSFRLNFEITALVIDGDFNRQVEAMLLTDFERSREVPANLIDEKSAGFQLRSKAASLLSPIL